MRRALSVWFPMFAIDLMRRAKGSPTSHDGRPILLMSPAPSGGGQRQLVTACCQHACAAGVRPGMPLGEARALLAPAAPFVAAAAPERAGAALRSLARWACRFSPIVAVDGEDGLLLDVSGCARALGGEDRLLHALLEGLARLGFRARAAAAPTFGCAWALARHGPAPAVIVGEGETPIREAIGPLPVRALGISPEAERDLAEVAIDRIDQLLALPRSALPARFGEELLLRLDQALGRVAISIDPVRPPATLHFARVFDGPTSQLEAIEQTVRELLEGMVAELRRRESGVRCLRIELVRSDAEPLRLTIPLSRPSREARHLWSLCRPRLERANLGFGVEEIAVTAVAVARLPHEQAEGAWVASLPKPEHEQEQEQEQEQQQDPDWAPGPHQDRPQDRHQDPHQDRDAAGRAAGPSQDSRRSKEAMDAMEESNGMKAMSECIDVLTSRLGPDRVLKADLVESHLPERAFRLAAPSSLSDAAPGAAGAARRAEGDRPPLLFERPWPVEVSLLAPDGPLVRLRWRGEEWRIAATIGPERIADEWWREEGPTCDYFKVQEEAGRWFWVCRELETGRWYIAGAWA